MTGEKPKQVDEDDHATPPVSVYPALIQLVAHSQDNKSTTLYNFLVFNTILLLAWATVFAVTKSWVHGAACSVLCIVGIVSCFAWEPLGEDYANASDLFGEKVEEVESQFPANLPRPLTDRAKQRTAKMKDNRHRVESGDSSLSEFVRETSWSGFHERSLSRMFFSLPYPGWHFLRLKAVQRTGASRFAQRQIERHRRLAPFANPRSIPQRDTDS